MKPLKRKFTSSLALFVVLSATQLASAFYDPSVGRWLSRDPIGEHDGPNVNSFVQNSPANLADKNGRESYALSGPGWSISYQSGHWRYNEQRFTAPPAPSVFDQFEWGHSVTPGENTAWIGEHYPRWLQVASRNATAAANRAILARCAKITRRSRVPVRYQEHVQPNHDDVNNLLWNVPAYGVTSTFYEMFGIDYLENWGHDNSETRYGDYQQTPWEANAQLGNFWFELAEVQVSFDSATCCVKWNGTLEAKDRLGIDRGDIEDNTANAYLAVIAGARIEDVVVRGRWQISGKVCCPNSIK